MKPSTRDIIVICPTTAVDWNKLLLRLNSLAVSCGSFAGLPGEPASVVASEFVCVYELDGTLNASVDSSRRLYSSESGRDPLRLRI